MTYFWHYVSLKPIVFVIGFCFFVPASPASEKSETPGLSAETAQVVKENSAAVVRIEVTARKKGIFRSVPFVLQALETGEEKVLGFELRWQDIGTGIFIDAQGHILTNYSVVGGSKQIKVLQVDGRIYPANVIGADPITDLAVIKLLVDQAIHVVTFGDSDSLHIGQKMVAMGFQRGPGQTMSRGTIRAVHRPGIKYPQSYQHLIQTDIPIDYANAGCPLLDFHGEVIGVNTAVASQDSGLHGVGFAIPGNAAVNIAKRLVSQGQVERGYLGIDIADLPFDLLESLNLKKPAGALISEVIKGGPADRAGIKKGDVVIQYGGKPILSSVDLLNRVAESPFGQKFEVTVYRHGTRRVLMVKVESFREFLMGQADSIKYRLGLEVGYIMDRNAQQYGFDGRQGVLVVALHPDSPLAEIGMEVNDIILEIEGHPVKGPEDFKGHIRALNAGQRVTILGLDHRTGRTGYIQVVVP